MQRLPVIFALSLVCITQAPASEIARTRIENIERHARATSGTLSDPDFGIALNAKKPDQLLLDFRTTLKGREVVVSFIVPLAITDETDATKGPQRYDLRFDCTDEGMDGAVDHCMVHGLDGSQRKAPGEGLPLEKLQAAFEDVLEVIENALAKRNPSR